VSQQTCELAQGQWQLPLFSRQDLNDRDEADLAVCRAMALRQAFTPSVLVTSGDPRGKFGFRAG